MTISELRVGQQNVVIDCFISSLEERKTNKGGSYVSVGFKDHTGETKANLWDLKVEAFGFKIKSVVSVVADVGEYQGKPQLNVKQVNPSPLPLNTFARRSTLPIDMMFETLEERHISKMQTHFIKHVCEELILKDPYKKLFCTAPAAKGVHHPWIGGLLEHVLGLCNLADVMYENHYRYYLPHLRMDLVKFGLMFHDWGKIVEYNYETPDISYTKRGCLQHHMGIAAEAVTRIQVKYEAERPTEKIPSRELLHEMTHIIYSHHGKPEWASIMTPATPEALFVHLLDYADAKLMHMWDLVKDGVEGDIPGMSKYSYMEKAAYALPLRPGERSYQ